jgi:hypothetical protein
MTQPTDGPDNHSEQAIRTFVEDYLDPGANLSRDDDPAEVIAGLEDVFGTDIGSTAEQLARYLATLDR